MRKIRRQSRTEEVEIPGITNKEEKPLKKLPETKPLEDKIEEISVATIQAIQLKYENRIKELEKKNKLLSKGDKLTKNEEKLLSAIKSEILKQQKSNPVIGRRVLVEEYKIGRKYLDDAIQGLILKEKIKREPVSYTAKVKTFSWELI